MHAALLLTLVVGVLQSHGAESAARVKICCGALMNLALDSMYYAVNSTAVEITSACEGK